MENSNANVLIHGNNSWTSMRLRKCK